MNLQNDGFKVRSTGELSVMLESMGGLVAVSSIIALFFVKSIISVLIILCVPSLYFLVAFLIFKNQKNAVMMNLIDSEGVKNSYLGNSCCELMWEEIGDFGIAEVKRGLFKGRYIYMSRIFVSRHIRKNIVKRYDPRVCIVFPCTAQVCREVNKASDGKIDIR